MTERLMVAVLKTAVSIFGTVGSNPTPSVLGLCDTRRNSYLVSIKRASK